jgi:hypothetical protein
VLRVLWGIGHTVFFATMSVLFVVGTAFGMALQLTVLLDDWVVLRSDQGIVPSVGWSQDS